ncbi:MAG: hypothetical protein N2380_03570 [bacterium]|nr:hypothetical protein [bacterium]
MKKNLISLVILFLFLLSYLVFANEKTPAEILSNAWNIEGKINLVATETNGIYMKDKLNITVSKVFVLSSGRFRREYIFPSFLAGDLLIDDGRNSYYYQPNKDTLTLGPSLYDPPHRDIHKKLIELILKNYDIYGQPDRFLNRDVTRISVTPKNGKIPLLILWIDNQTNLILKRERYSADGKLQEYSFYTDIDFSTIPDERLFVWTNPKKDFRIIDRRERFIPLEEFRKRLSSLVGFSPLQEKGYECISIKEVPDGLAYHFSDGINNVLVFELRIPPPVPPDVRRSSIEGIRYSYWQFDGMSGFAWSYKRRNFLVIGIVERDIIEKVIKNYK